MSVCPILYASDEKESACKTSGCAWWDEKVNKCAVLSISQRLEAIRPISAIQVTLDSISKNMPSQMPGR